MECVSKYSNKRWQRWNHRSDWFLDPLQGSTGKIMRIKKAQSLKGS